MCTELVPEHMMDLKNELSGRNPAALYRHWPSAKRTLKPFSIMLPGQVMKKPRERGGGLRARTNPLWDVQ